MKLPSPDAVTNVQPTDAGKAFGGIDTCLHWRQRVFMKGAAAALALTMHRTDVGSASSD